MVCVARLAMELHWYICVCVSLRLGLLMDAVPPSIFLTLTHGCPKEGCGVHVSRARFTIGRSLSISGSYDFKLVSSDFEHCIFLL